MRNLRLLCLGMWQWENGFSVHVCWQTCFGQVIPSPIAGCQQPFQGRSFAIPKKPPAELSHISSIHKIHVCHIYLCLFLVGLQPKHDPNVMTVGANVTGCYSKKTLWLEQETKTKNTTPVAVEKKSKEIQGW